MILNNFILYEIYTKIPDIKSSPLFQNVSQDIDKKLKEYEEYVNRAGCSSCAKRAKLGDVGAYISDKVQDNLRHLVETNKKFFKELANKCKEYGIMIASDNLIIMVLKDKFNKPEFVRISI